MSFGSNPENFDFFFLCIVTALKTDASQSLSTDNSRVPKLQVVCIFVFKLLKSQK